MQVSEGFPVAFMTVSHIFRRHQNHMLVCYRRFSLFANNQLQRRVGDTFCHSGRLLIFYRHPIYPESKLWRIFLLCCPEPPSPIFSSLRGSLGDMPANLGGPLPSASTEFPTQWEVWCHLLAGPNGEGQASAIRSLSFLQIQSHK